MNDDPVDRVLTEAGARWRAGQPDPPEPDPTRLGRPRRRWPAVTVAAASVAAVAVGVVVAVPASHRRPAAPPASTAPSPPPAGPAALIVHNGDLVEASGYVIAVPGQPVIFCSRHLLPLPGPGPVRQPPTCPAHQGVPLTGIRVDRLTDLSTVRGVRFGTAILRGTWRDGTIRVSWQGPLVDPPTSACPTPAGGWQPGSLPDPGPVRAYLRQHKDRFGKYAIAVPERGPNAPGTQVPSQVLFVRTSFTSQNAGLALEALRRELASVYPGNLCVMGTLVPMTERDRLQRTWAAVWPLAAARGHGVDAMMWPEVRGTSGGSGAARQVSVNPARVVVALTVLDERWYATFSRIGFGAMELLPSVRPVGR